MLLRTSRRLALLALVLSAPVALGAQSSGTAPAQPAPPQGAQQNAQQPPWPAARTEDVASMDAILATLYAVISGPPGQARDWDRMKSLFHPTARMEPIVPRQAGGFAAVVLTPDDYVRRSGETLTKFGFAEKEVARKVERFGHLVHVWSTYEGRFSSPDAPTKETIRGINSIQLQHDGTRWWILNIAWEAERPDNPLPAHYLPAK
jgi:hypothetical protein